MSAFRVSRRERLLLSVYSLTIEAVVWALLAPWTLARVLGHRATMAELRARLGASRIASSHPIVIHGVSLGEINATESLVRILSGTPHPLALTTGTAAGYGAAMRLAERYPRIQLVTQLPWDRRAIRPWLRSVSPAALVVVETEIWPNLFIACAELGIPLCMVNGRLRANNVPRYRSARGLFGAVLRAVTWIGTEDPEQQERFIAIGAPPDRIAAVGDLKTEPLAPPPILPVPLVPGLPGELLLVAGSTHAPEEGLLVDTLATLGPSPRVRLVLAPRAVGRAAAVVRACRRRAIEVKTWSALRAAGDGCPADWDVLVVDEYGWLRSFYAQADLVFLGGTIAPVGGHNIIEAASLGKPVIVGPHTEHIAGALRRLEECGSVARIAGVSARSVAAILGPLVSDPQRRRTMGQAARIACESGSSVADRYAREILARANCRRSD